MRAQQLMQKHSEGKGVGSAPKSKPGRWGLTAEGRSRAAHSDFAPPNADDPNDELCRICLQGVSLLTSHREVAAKSPIPWHIVPSAVFVSTTTFLSQFHLFIVCFDSTSTYSWDLWSSSAEAALTTF